MKKRVLAIMITVALFLSVLSASAAYSFEDVKKNAWYRPAVSFCFDKNWFQGVSKRSFDPEGDVSRAMFAVVIYRMSGSRNTYKNYSFHDVKAGKWYADGVEYCARNGIVNGYDKTTFAPNKAISRQEMMTMLYRFSQSQRMNLSVPKDALNGYEDAGKIASYAKTPIAWCVSRGIVEGTDYKTLLPRGKASRCQLAQIAMNYAERIWGVSTAQYYKDSKNPYGLHVSGARVVDGKAFFTLLGQRSDMKMRVTYTVSDGTIFTKEYSLGVGAFRCEQALKQAQEYLKLGLLHSVSAKAVVFLNNKSIFEKSLYFGKFFSNPTGEKLYFKGQTKFDSRIILYHEINETEAPKETQYSVRTTIRRLEENIKEIDARGYTFISLAMLRDFWNGNRALPKKTVVVTFDDGYVSNYKLAFPILKKYNVPTTIFVTVSAMGDTGHFNWEQARKMEKSGFITIGSHSWKHVKHNKLDEKTLKEYYRKSFATLEEHLGKRQYKLFAYPYGLYTPQTIQLAKKAGISMQMTTNSFALDMEHLNFDCLPRITMSYNSRISDIFSIPVRR